MMNILAAGFLLSTLLMVVFAMVLGFQQWRIDRNSGPVVQPPAAVPAGDVVSAIPATPI